MLRMPNKSIKYHWLDQFGCCGSNLEPDTNALAQSKYSTEFVMKYITKRESSSIWIVTDDDP